MTILKQLMAQIQWQWHNWPLAHTAKPLPYKSCHQIGILARGEKNTDLLTNDLILHLQQDKKVVRSLCFTKQEAVRWNEKVHLNTFSAKDLHINGMMQSKFIDQFLKKSYDIIINTSAVACPFTEQIMARCKTKLRIGLYAPDREKRYDLLVKPNSQGNSLQDSSLISLYNYLKKI